MGFGRTGAQATQVGLDSYQLAAGVLKLQYEVRWNVALAEARALRFEHAPPAPERHGQLFEVGDVIGYVGHGLFWSRVGRYGRPFVTTAG